MDIQQTYSYIYDTDYLKQVIVENCQKKLLFHMVFTIQTLPRLVMNMSQLFFFRMNSKYC